MVEAVANGWVIVAQHAGKRQHVFAPAHVVPPAERLWIGRRVRFAAERSRRRNLIAVDLEPADATAGRVAAQGGRS